MTRFTALRVSLLHSLHFNGELNSIIAIEWTKYWLTWRHSLLHRLDLWKMVKDWDNKLNLLSCTYHSFLYPFYLFLFPVIWPAATMKWVNRNVHKLPISSLTASWAEAAFLSCLFYSSFSSATNWAVQCAPSTKKGKTKTNKKSGNIHEVGLL